MTAGKAVQGCLEFMAAGTARTAAEQTKRKEIVVHSKRTRQNLLKTTPLGLLGKTRYGHNSGVGNE
jgi:hypothetical protein